MVTIESQFFVARIGGREITDFLLDCTDDRYRRWWPGTHLALHAVSRGRDHVGDVVLMDEYGKASGADARHRRSRRAGSEGHLATEEGTSVAGPAPPSWPIAAAGSTCGTRSRPGSVASGGSSTRCSGATRRVRRRDGRARQDRIRAPADHLAELRHRS